MFTGIEPLTVLGLMTLAASEKSICKMPKPTEINVVPYTKEVTVDTSQTLAEIQKATMDTINPYGFGTQSHTNGYMRGGIQTSHSIKLDHKFVYRNRAVCLWYDKIELKISITPEIVIAKEVAEDKCRFRAVKGHEMKHVMVDRKIVNKYAKSMGQKIYSGLKSRGFMVGPIEASRAQEVAKRMQETVGQLLEVEFKKMEIDRSEMQQAVDSLEEYERVSAMCDKKGRRTNASRKRR